MWTMYYFVIHKWTFLVALIMKIFR